MNDHIRQIGLGAGAALIALGLAVAVFASPHTQNTSDPQGLFNGRQGGPPLRGVLWPGGARGPMGLIGPLIGQLDLTDAQRDQVKSLMESHRGDFQPLAERARAARKALEQGIMLDPVSDAAVRQASAEVAAVEADSAVVVAHARSEIFQIRTDAQKAKAKQMIARLTERSRVGDLQSRGR